MEGPPPDATTTAWPACTSGQLSPINTPQREDEFLPAEQNLFSDSTSCKTADVENTIIMRVCTNFTLVETSCCASIIKCHLCC